MATAQLLHLLNQPPQADGPDASTILSATVPWSGNLTTRLLDPALPPSGGAQTLSELKLTSAGGTTKSMILGRFLSKPLPAQTIGAGNWTLAASMRVNNTSAADTTVTLWGFCVAQWRPGTGLIARFLDSPTGGTAFTPLNPVTLDVSVQSTVAGGALTLVANDCLAVEVWFTVAFTGVSNLRDWSLLLGGQGAYVQFQYQYQALGDTDATLKAPAAITFS